MRTRQWLGKKQHYKLRTISKTYRWDIPAYRRDIVLGPGVVRQSTVRRPGLCRNLASSRPVRNTSLTRFRELRAEIPQCQIGK